MAKHSKAPSRKPRKTAKSAESRKTVKAGSRRRSRAATGMKKQQSLHNWTAAELRVLKPLRSPEQIQSYIDKMPFDASDSTFSVRQTLLHKTGDCFSCGLLAAYCLSRLGYPPLLLGMECDPRLDEPGHIIVPYRRDGLWGAISKSNYTGIRGRDPVYRTVRELVMSYFEFVVSKDGTKILRTYSDPFNLDKVDPTRDWVWRTDIPSGGRHIEPFSDDCPRRCLPVGFKKNKLCQMRGTTLKSQKFGANPKCSY
eukprot:TRINITY_DN79416_c0_g1_i1.p1 TRINITY_DN79416_c0_g1~~TRINITY_DN79416_c0_g1_i1.p1  ORF type:complete len:254 (+),score=28.02 TRINITY_DN79416_c0_g1_i1:79-840(+)